MAYQPFSGHLRDIQIGLIWGAMVNVKTWYRHDTKLCSISVLLCCSFFLHVVVPFLPNYFCRMSLITRLCHVFLFSCLPRVFFSTIHAACPCLTVSFQAIWHPPSNLCWLSKKGFILSTSGLSGQNLPPLFLSQWICWLLLCLYVTNIQVTVGLTSLFIVWIVI